MQLQEQARTAARRVRVAIPSFRQESEEAVTAAFSQLLEAILDAAAARSAGAIEPSVDELIAPGTRRIGCAEVVLLLEHVELALGELIRAEEGVAAAGSGRWRAIQVFLHRARLHAVTQACAATAKQREISEGQLAAVLETLPQLVLLANAEHRVIYANGRSREFLGLDPAEIVGKDFTELMTPAVLERFADADAFLNGTALMHAAPDRSHEDRIRLTDGRMVLRRSLPLRGADWSGRLAVYSDITGLFDFRAVFETAILPQLLLDSERRVVDANPAACALVDVAKERLVDVRLDEFVEVEDSGAFSRRWHAFLERGRRQGELRFRRPDGTLREIVFSASANALPGRHLLIAQDVSEQKQLERQLRQAQKMEAIGQLAAGVAHDFNNLLMVISGYSQVLLRRGGDAEDMRELGEIVKASERATRLTSQLLAFSRRQALEPRVISLNDVLREAQAMFERLIRADIELTVALTHDLASVRADVGQIEQLIVNLVANARDAMPDGGRLLLETANVVLDETFVRGHEGAAAGDYVLLAVTDTGYGMDAETVGRIFEPFFTTKEQGKGTGLGLATAYGVVKQSGGYISVESEVGRGTSFKVYLPQVDEQAEELAPSEPRDRPLVGAETILLVEDEHAVRRLTQEILEEYGYTVIAAVDGQHALELAEGRSGAIDLLMTDIVMPNLGGIALAERLTAAHPGLRVLYTSGYSEEAAGGQTFAPGTAFLQKPYGMETLAGKLRELLDRPGRRQP